MFRQSLAKLKEEVLKANSLVHEANSLAKEMTKDTDFSVTLQIPACNLTPNRKVNLTGPITTMLQNIVCRGYKNPATMEQNFFSFLKHYPSSPPLSKVKSTL